MAITQILATLPAVLNDSETFYEDIAERNNSLVTTVLPSINTWATQANSLALEIQAKAENAINAISFDNIAQLKLNSNINRVDVLGYYTKGDGGGGIFYWDSTSIETDNGGTIIQSTGITTGRWKRPKNEIIDIKEFGGNLKKALEVCPEYTTILLDIDTYNIKDLYTHNFNFGNGPFIGNTKKGIKLVGKGMPRVSANGRSLIDGSGTIIQGTLFNLADDFECYDLGVDFGHDVIDNLYNGEYGEVFVPGANTSFPTPQTQIKNVKVNNVIALGANPVSGNANTYKHTMLFENLIDCTIGYVESIGSFHGFVSKVENLYADTIVSKGGSLEECVIFKSDAANTCKNNFVTNLILKSCTLNNTLVKSGGLFFDHGQLVENINITNLKIENSSKDAVRESGASVLSNICIGTANIDIGDSGNITAFRFGYYGEVTRFIVDSFNIITQGMAIESGLYTKSSMFGTGTITSITDSGISLVTTKNNGISFARVGINLISSQTSDFYISNDFIMDTNNFFFYPSPHYDRFKIFKKLNEQINITNGGWSGFPDSSTPYFIISGSSLVAGGVATTANSITTTGTIGTILIPPHTAKRFIVSGEASGSNISVHLEFTTAGEIIAIGNYPVGTIIRFDGINYGLYL